MGYMLTGIIINLRGAVDRRLFAWENVSKLQVNAVVLNAVEAYSISENLYFNVTKSAQACFESHRLTWQYVIEENLDVALVCEDDFFPTNNLDLESILVGFEQLDWDIVQIGFLKIGVNAKIEVFLKNIQAKLFKIIGKFINRLSASSTLLERKRIKEGYSSPNGFVYGDFQSGSHAYLVSQKGAEKLLSLPTNIMPVDAVLHILAECNSINSFRSTKSFVQQYSFPSQISDRNH